MENTYFFVPGAPRPLKRARVRSGVFYDPNTNDKNDFICLLKSRYSPVKMEGAVRLVVHFYFKMPPSWSVKKKAEYYQCYHTHKPDTSNLVKFVEDALEGICYANDSAIAVIEADKRWSDEDATVFTITTIE